MCEYCQGALPLVIGKTNDQGICIKYPNKLHAYGYDVHGSGSNGLSVDINFCPKCGRELSPLSSDKIKLGNNKEPEFYAS